MRFLTLTLLSLLALSTVAVSPAGAQASVGVEVTELTAEYAPEGWKDEAADPTGLGAASPVPALPAGWTGVYENPYRDPTRPHEGPGANWWGYMLDATATVTADDAGIGGASYTLKAWVETSGGRLPMKLAKLNATTFRLQADLDGENGKSYPVLTDGGAYLLVMEVHRSTDPTVRAQKVATVTHPLNLHRGTVNPTGVLFAESDLPGYDEVAPTNYTTLHLGSLHPDGEVTARFRFAGAAGAPAKVQLIRGTTSTVLHEGPTDAQGYLTVTFQPGTALGGADTGLLLLEGHLTGANSTLGNAVVALPVTPHAMEITSLQYEARPPAVDDEVRELSTIQVVARDPNPSPLNNSRHGTLYLMRGIDAFATADFSASVTSEYRTARYRATTVAAEELTNYGLLALFFNEQNQFYGLASAHRGASVSVGALTTTVDERVKLPITVSNLNTNYNGDVDAGLASTVHVRVTGLPDGSEFSDEITLEEGSRGVVEVPFLATQTGSYPLEVNATSGEFAFGYQTVATVNEPAGAFDLQRIRETVPGPGASLLLAAIAAAALVAARRRDA